MKKFHLVGATDAVSMQALALAIAPSLTCCTCRPFMRRPAGECGRTPTLRRTSILSPSFRNHDRGRPPSENRVVV